MHDPRKPLLHRAGPVRRTLAVVAFAGAFLVPIACSPLDTSVGSGTVELPADAGLARSATSTLGSIDDDAVASEVLGTSIERPAGSATTSAPPTAPPTEPAPAPAPTEPAPVDTAPPVEVTTSTEAPPAPAPVLTAASLFAARATEGLSSSEDREIASQALASIVYDWRNSLPGWEVRFLDSRPGYRGITYPDLRVIEVYVRSGDTARSLAHVVADEMGHAVDVTWFSDATRSAWLSARGFGPGTTWFVDSGGADFASGAGDFAESFAWWQVGPPAWFGELGPPPSDAQLLALAGLVLHP